MVKDAKGIVQNVPKEDPHKARMERQQKDRWNTRRAITREPTIRSTSGESVDPKVTEFLRNIIIAPRLNGTDEVERLLLSGNIGRFLERACNDGDCNFGISIHYSQKSSAPVHYTAQLAETMQGGRNVKSIVFHRTPLADKVLSLLSSLMKEQPAEIHLPMKKRPIRVEGAEIHLLGPHETMVLQLEKGLQAVKVNPCTPLSNEKVVLVARFPYMLNDAREYEISLDKLPITGHGGYMMLDGERIPHSITKNDAIINMLVWTLYMSKLGAFDLEIMPQKNPSSEYLMGDPDCILTLCSAPNVHIVPDIAHIMLNNKVMDFEGPGPKFKYKIRNLLKRAEARETEIMLGLMEANELLNNSGVPVALTFEEIKEHLERLEYLAEKPCDYSGPKGLGALFGWLDVAKRLGGVRDQKRLMRVAHVVLAAPGANGTDANIADVKSVADALELFKSDRPFRHGVSERGDRIMQAVVARAAMEMESALRKGEPVHKLLIVDESPLKELETLAARLKTGMQLKENIGSVFRQLLETGIAA